MQDFIEDNSQRPHIHSIGVVVKPGLLRRNVLLCARDGFHDDLLGTQPEVSDLNRWDGLVCNILCLQQDILGFQISMGNAVIVQFLHSLADLVDDFQGVLLVHFIVAAAIQRVPNSVNGLPEGASFAIFCNVPDACGALDDVINFQNMLVFYSP